jgi:hypothetical protein
MPVGFLLKELELELLSESGISREVKQELKRQEIVSVVDATIGGLYESYIIPRWDANVGETGTD